MYSEVRKAHEEAGDWFSVSRVLKCLKVSTSGYYDWLQRGPSRKEQKRLQLQQEIMDIYEGSHQIYGAPKITKQLRSDGKKVSERTVSRYMRDMHIHAWYRRPYTRTTFSVDFTDRLEDLLKRDFSRNSPMRSGVPTSPTFIQKTGSCIFPVSWIFTQERSSHGSWEGHWRQDQ